MNRVTPKTLKSVFPWYFPKDVVNIIDGFLYNDIRRGTKKLYKHVTNNFVSSSLISRTKFADVLTTAFIVEIGSTFEEFLSINAEQIEDESCYAILYSATSIYACICPKFGLFNEVQEKVDELCEDYVVKVLTKMAIDEGYVDKTSEMDLEEYLESLEKS